MKNGCARFFRLNPECYLVLGGSRSVVHNLYTGEVLWCDEDDTRVLARCERNSPLEEAIPTILLDLKEKRWGRFFSAPPFVDKLRTFNAFREKRLWRETPFVRMAILQVSNECEAGCVDCRTHFCPICTVFDPGEHERRPLACEEWLALIEDLRRFGTERILFTGGEALSVPWLDQLLEKAASLGIGVQVHTSGKSRLPIDFPDVPLSALVMDDDSVSTVVDNLKKRREVTLMNCGADAQRLAEAAEGSWEVLAVDRTESRITPRNLAKTDLVRFFARKAGDDCLDGKVYIAYDGAVYPCFGYRAEPIADIRADGVSGAVRALVDGWWTRSVDDTHPDRKCTRCEFRYCCNTCKLVDSGRCDYDTAVGVWSPPRIDSTICS